MTNTAGQGWTPSSGRRTVEAMTSDSAPARRPTVLVACGQGDRLLTVEEVAEWLGVPVGTIYAWRYRSTGPASYKVGRHVRFRPSDVEQWLEAQRTEPAQPSTLRQLLGVSPARKVARTVIPTRIGLRATAHVRKSLRHRGSATPGAHGANPRPRPRIVRRRGRGLGVAGMRVEGWRRGW